MKTVKEQIVEMLGYRDELVPIVEAARELGMSKWTLRRLADEGKIKICRPSPRRLSVWRSEIIRYANSTTMAPKAA